jgi:hypothetical protein
MAVARNDKGVAALLSGKSIHGFFTDRVSYYCWKERIVGDQWTFKRAARGTS